MSETNSTFPFPGTEPGGTLDINSIFGEVSADDDVNPFDMPVAAGPIETATAPAEAAAEPKTSATVVAEPETVATTTEPQPAPTEAATEPEQPQAADVSTQQPPKAATEPKPESNPIADAFAQQTEKNEQQGLLEKSPVFSYGSAKEAIADPGMTFEELRIAKADDFPELAEGKKVSWTVEYGKVVKTISDPKGTVIRAIKSEIEMSKQFLDGLKKAKDKCPDCLVKPKVTAQSKGIAAYKGVFSSLEAARASDKTICILPSGDGRVYEMRKSELGEFIAPKDKVVEFPQIRAGFTPALPRIPMLLLSQIISFFRCYMSGLEEFEALAHILWDKELEQYVVYIPEQEVSKARVHADLKYDAYPEERYLHYADIHSHNSMAAKFSSTDDADEKATRLYIVLGRLDRFFPEISVRMSCGGMFQPIDPADVLERIDETFPCQWHDHVKKQPQIPDGDIQSRLPYHFREETR